MESTFDTEWMTEKPKGIRQFHHYKGYAKRHGLSILNKARQEAVQPAEEIGAATRAVGPRGKHGFIRAQPGRCHRSYTARLRISQQGYCRTIRRSAAADMQEQLFTARSHGAA